MFFNKKKNWQEEFDIALLLIFSAERLLTARKVHEAFHNGSSAGFEENPFLLIKLQEYLADKKIRRRLETLIKSAQN